MRQIICLLLMLLISPTSRAVSIIEDAEISALLADITRPLLAANKLKDIKIYVVNSSEINAFTAGGRSLFLHTGLIQKLPSLQSLLGVIAHEIGHIESAHVAAHRDKVTNMHVGSAASLMVGMATALLSPALALGIIAGGTGISMQNYFLHRMLDESVADRLGLQYLTRARIPLQGMAEAFSVLSAVHRIHAARTLFARTHPSPADRLIWFKRYSQAPNQKPLNGPVWRKLLRCHKVLQGKIDAYTHKPKRLLTLYDKRSDGLGRYLKSIALYRDNQFDSSLSVLKNLLIQQPNNPYLWELKGDILLSLGRASEALKMYKKAHQLAPKASLLSLDLAKCYLNLTQPKKALAILKPLVQRDRTLIGGWRLMAGAYTLMGQGAFAAYAGAEESFLQGRYRRCLRLLNVALKSDEVRKRHQIIIEMLKQEAVKYAKR
jgi:predicted Zn-dependent protease